MLLYSNFRHTIRCSLYHITGSEIFKFCLSSFVCEGNLTIDMMFGTRCMTVSSSPASSNGGTSNGGTHQNYFQ